MFRLWIALTVAVVVVLPWRASEAAENNLGDQLFKLTFADPAPGDNFGIAVAIDGDLAIVGAHLKTTGRPNTGKVYLFDVATGTQVRALTAVDAETGDQFGISVAIDGNRAIVGARLDDEAGADAGAVYIFDVNTGTQLHKLTADHASAWDNFGCSVAVSGNTAIVGADLRDGPGQDAGAAYVFDVIRGVQLFELTADDAAAGDRFGTSVGISGNIAIVGAIWNDDAGLNSGSAYVFNLTTGKQIFKLTADDAATYEYFGCSTAISGNRAIVGAYWDNFDEGREGAAYLFDVTTGNQLYKLTAADSQRNQLFGYSVAIAANTAIVGARFDDDGGYASGAAYLFEVTTGNQLVKLTANDAADNDHLGYSVGISEGRCIAGSPADRHIGITSGSACLFESTTDPPTSVGAVPTIPFVVHPNPFRSTATVNFTLHQSGHVRLGVWDVRGRRVRTLFEGPLPSGSRAVSWDGYTDGGKRASSGVYFVRLETPGAAALARKVVLRR